MSLQNLNFYKMQSLGNDYIYIDCINNNYNILDIAKYAVILSNRNFGIGSDGLVFISKKNDNYYMDMYNADGSYSKICGNAFRCVAYLLHYLGYIKNVCIIHSGDFAVKAEVLDNSIVKIQLPYKAINYVSKYFTILDKTFEYYYVDIGNPHCVILYKDNLDNLDINAYSKEITRKKDVFPNGINIEFYQVLAVNKLKMRVYERGAGETLSCGSGACAVSLVYSFLHNSSDTIRVESKGGFLDIKIYPTIIELKGLVDIIYKGVVI